MHSPIREGVLRDACSRLPINLETENNGSCKVAGCGLRFPDVVTCGVVELRVASCGFRLVSPLQYAVDAILSKNATRNLYGYVFFALYL